MGIFFHLISIVNLVKHFREVSGVVFSDPTSPSCPTLPPLFFLTILFGDFLIGSSFLRFFFILLRDTCPSLPQQ